jgi:hypothetical protein
MIDYAIYFANAPSPAEPGQLVSLRVYLSAGDTDTHDLILYSQNSRSFPSLGDFKWSHLRPEWNFLDSGFNLISSISATDTILYDSSGNTIGTTGYADFYYVDDMPTKVTSPIKLWATLDTHGKTFTNLDYSRCINSQLAIPGYANSLISTYTNAVIKQQFPTHLKITKNGIDPIDPLQWAGNSIYNVITINSSGARTFTNYCSSYLLSGESYQTDGVIFDYPQEFTVSQQAAAQNPLHRGVYDPVSAYPTKIVDGKDIWIQRWELVDPNAAEEKQQDNSRDAWRAAKNDDSVTTVPWNPIPAYFRRYQEANSESLYNGGYIRNRAIIADRDEAETTTAYITAEVEGVWKYSSEFSDDSPVVTWVSNPGTNKIYRGFFSSEITGSDIFYGPAAPSAYSDAFSVPYLGTADPGGAAGYSGIFGIAMNPCGDVWMAEPALSKIYRVNSSGSIAQTIDLVDGSSPAGISLDGNGNIFVTLFDSVSVLKYDNNGTHVDTFTPIWKTGYQYPDFPNPGASAIDNLFKPTAAEPDRNNHVWVTYTNTVCCFLVKYDNYGNRLLDVDLPVASNPTDIVVDYDNNIYVTLTYHASAGEGEVRKYRENGSLINSWSFEHPMFITPDRDNGVWFTYSNMSIANINEAGTVAYDLCGIASDPSVITPSLSDNYYDGIACDSFNRIWVINGYEKRAYIINQNDGTRIGYIELGPLSVQEWYNDLGYTYYQSSIYNKGPQAFGDWTGQRWMQKYYAPIQPDGTITFKISGISDPFEIKRFKNYDIRKYNESWDAVERLKAYNPAFHISHNNPVLFDQVFGAVYNGTSNEDIENPSFGRSIYEKIANFVQNHRDVDACNIDQLYSLAEELDVPIDNYNLNFPFELNRIMDLISVNQQTLWGGNCPCNRNIWTQFKSYIDEDNTVSYLSGYCRRCGHDHVGNRGELFNPLTYMCTAYIPFVLFDRTEETYSYIVPPRITETTILTTYPLSDYWDTVLPKVYSQTDFVASVTPYCFYAHVDLSCGYQIAGVVNWSDEYTTLNKQLSTADDWYGDGGIIDQYLNYILRKNLDLEEY